MFKQMQVKLLGLVVLLALTACGGGDDGITSRTVVFAPVAAQEAPTAASAPLASRMSDEQRLAEETRMIAFEQSFSVEMQRRHLESQQRSAQFEQERSADLAAASMQGASSVQ